MQLFYSLCFVAQSFQEIPSSMHISSVCWEIRGLFYICIYAYMAKVGIGYYGCTIYDFHPVAILFFHIYSYYIETFTQARLRRRDRES